MRLRVDALPPVLRPPADVGVRAVARFAELEGFDRAMALAGQTFAALLPLLIVVGAVSPGGGRDVTAWLVEELNLSGSAAEALRSAMAQPAEVEQAVSLLGFVLLVVSALSFTRAMQRLYVRAWRLPSMGARGNGWGLAWLVCLASFIAVQPLIAGLLDGRAAAVLSLALSTLLSLFTPWVLVGGRIGWRRLLPQALLTATGLAAFGAWATLYAPRAVGSAAREFGVIGVAFALLSLLFFVACVVVAAAALGAVLAERSASGAARGEAPAGRV